MTSIDAAIEHTPAEHMRDGVENYLLHGIEPGGFLTAVLANDFKGVVGRADSTNIRLLREWAEWVYNWCPSPAQGSYERVASWCKSGGMDGQIHSGKIKIEEKAP